jgi:hypothetical protein
MRVSIETQPGIAANRLMILKAIFAQTIAALTSILSLRERRTRQR